MNNKNLALLWLACAFPGAAYCEEPLAYVPGNSVALYGSIDIGITYMSNSQGHPRTFMDSGVFRASRFGFKGREDLGSGLSAIFTLENGFFPQNGTAAAGGGIFGRQSYVGLASRTWGTVTMGRQYDFMGSGLYQYGNADNGGVYAFHHGDYDHVGGNERTNNSVKYVSPVWGGFHFGAMYGFTDLTAAPSDPAERVVSAGAYYELGAFSAQASFANLYDVVINPSTNLGVSTIFGLPATGNITAQKITIGGVGASYVLGPVRIRGMVTDVKIYYNGHAASMPTYDAVATYYFGAGQSLSGGAQRSTLEGSAWTQYTTSYTYALSKRTTLYATVNFQRASGDARNAVMNTLPPSSTKTLFVPRIGMSTFF